MEGWKRDRIDSCQMRYGETTAPYKRVHSRYIDFSKERLLPVSFDLRVAIGLPLAVARPKKPVVEVDPTVELSRMDATMHRFVSDIAVVRELDSLS